MADTWRSSEISLSTTEAGPDVSSREDMASSPPVNSSSSVTQRLIVNSSKVLPKQTDDGAECGMCPL